MKLGFSPRPRQSGTSLIEAIVSLLVLALGVMGMLSVQLKSMSDNQNAIQRVIAVRLADDLFERMKSNAGVITPYVSETPPSTEPSTNCDLSPCSSVKQAEFDLWKWRDRVKNMLTGGGKASTFPTDDPRQLLVMISWPSRKNDAAKNLTGGVDWGKTEYRYNWLKVDVPSKNATCPLDRLCYYAYTYR